MLKLAVVTPYWKETPETLSRCMETVRQQTVAATHYLVADGVPQSLPESPSIVHVILPENIGNSGATPRGIGAQLAFNDGFDAVAFIDADNWLEPDHLEKAALLLERDNLDVVFARRNIIFPDGERLMVEDKQDETHVDTNCYIISRRAAFLAIVWEMWPREFGTGEDRMMFMVIRHFGLRTAWLDAPTVWYETNWRVHYDLANKKPVRPMRQPSRRVAISFDRKRFYRGCGIDMPVRRGVEAVAIVDRPPSEWRIAVVTPCQGEGQDALLRCIDSVARQSGVVMHYVVSDASMQCPVIDRPNVRHLVLHGARDDHGNTARGMGAAIAFQLGADAVIFLGAGGWFEDGHVQALLKVLAEKPVQMLLCAPALKSAGEGHVGIQKGSAGGDAMSVLVSSEAAFLAAMWAQLPRLPTLGHALNLLKDIAIAKGVSVGRTTSSFYCIDPKARKTATERVGRTALSREMLFAKTGMRMVKK